MTPDPDLYGPPDRDNEDPQQDDDWDLLFEWAPPPEETTGRIVGYQAGGRIYAPGDVTIIRKPTDADS